VKNKGLFRLSAVQSDADTHAYAQNVNTVIVSNEFDLYMWSVADRCGSAYSVK